MTAAAQIRQPGPNVCSCMADNWMLDIPALQVNPAASPVALLGWCYGELVSLESIAAALGSTDSRLSGEDVNAIFTHRLVPLREVLSHAIDLINADERAKTGSSA